MFLKRKKLARDEMLLYPWEINSGRPAQFLVQELLAISLDFITDPAVASLFHVTKKKVNSDLYSPIFLASDWVKPEHGTQLWSIRFEEASAGGVVCFWEMFLYLAKGPRKRGAPSPRHALDYM